MGKNIVVLCDGTWNSPMARTNVYVLYRELLERDYKQHVKYIDGVGVGEFGLKFILDGAMALNLDTKIKEGYKFIVEHFNPDDDIWLFGFSRGAYTARCIAGMIRNCGILKIDRQTYHPEGTGSENFRKTFSYPDSKKKIIKFLGLWDTVGAHGLPGYTIDKGFEYLEFHDET
ncbi:hypothetical protein C1646_777893, partial [Rhizophagus diaphanus]